MDRATTERLNELADFRSRAARALLLVHEQALQEFVETWRRAREANIRLPASPSPNYASLEALLRHTLRVPGFNMRWICEQLRLPDPGIEDPPPPERIEGAADAYLVDLLPKLRAPLRGVEDARLKDIAYPSRWQQPYTIGGMLEHLVAHALTHRFQLEELMAAQSSGALAEG